MSAAASVAPIRKADRAAIRAHLQMLFGRVDAIVPGSMVDVVWSDAELSKLNEFERFPATPAGLDRAAEKAAQVNELGRNVYTGALARKPGTRGNSTNDDIAFALHHFIDADTIEGAGEVMLWNGATPSATVRTGTEPFERSHLYWTLEAPEFNLSQWTARQKALAAAMSADPSPVDPRRVMRLPGTWSFPKAGKAAKGYRTEMVTSDQTGTVTTPDRLMRGLDYAAPAPSAPEDGAKPIGDESLLARDQEDLLRIVASTPNELDYHEWMAFAHALKAATGGSDEGYDAFEAWSLQYAGNTPEQCQAKWDSITESKIGADFIYAHASRAGIAVSSAPQDFEALEPDPEPYVAPAPKPAQRSAPTPQMLPENFDPTKIELRKWVLGRRFLVGAVTAGLGAPGVGKSTFSILTGLSIATGRELTGERVYRRGKVWIHNHEDDTDELLRRIAGVCLHYGLNFNDVRPNLLFSSGAVTRLTVAVKEGDIVKRTDAVREIIRTIKDMGIVYMAVDPLVSTHEGCNENSNTEIEKVVDAFRVIARETGCAIDLVHHTVKDHSGDTESRAGDMNASRGAGATIGAVRISYTLSPMSLKGAEDRGIPLTLAGNLVRLDNAKGNYAAKKLGQPVWFEMKSVSIGNGNDDVDDLLCEDGQESDTVAVHTVYDLSAQIAESAEEESKRQAILDVSYQGDIVSEFPRGTNKMPQGELADRLLKRWDIKRTQAQERIRSVIPDGRDSATVVEMGGTRYLVYRTAQGDHASAAKYVHAVAV